MTGIVDFPPYPVLEAGNLSFPRGQYELEIVSRDDGVSVQVTHRLKGATLLERFVEDGRAKYGCLVSIPQTGYKKLHLCEVKKNVQTVEWSLGDVGEPPIIRPILVSVEDFKHKFSPEDGIDKAWEGKTVEIPKGAKLARAVHMRSVASLKSMITVQLDENLSSGSFTVEIDENQGFRFTAYAAKDLHEFLQSHGTINQELYRSMVAHIVSMCFVTLCKEQGVDEDNQEKWSEFSNLQMLSDLLEKEGLPHWSDDKFKPEQAALQLYPLLLPDQEDG